MKIIDKILYYFGYAPITVRHEVIFHSVGKVAETFICRSVFEINERDFKGFNPNIDIEKYIKREVKMRIIEEIDKEGLINYIKIHNDFYPTPRVVAELQIVKPLNYGL